MKYNKAIEDSRDYKQIISIKDYNITLTVKSIHDPEMIYHDITKGKDRLDEDPNGEWWGALFLLIMSVFMLIMTSYRVYRFCTKKVFKSYF